MKKWKVGFFYGDGSAEKPDEEIEIEAKDEAEASEDANWRAWEKNARYFNLVPIA